VVSQQEKTLKSTVDSNYNLLPELFGLEKNSSDFNAILEASIRRISIIESQSSIDSIIEQMDIIDKLMILEDLLFHYFNIIQYIKYENI
jgi:hypothetical protein